MEGKDLADCVTCQVFLRIVQFPYSPERVVAIRRVPGRRWHDEGKYWSVPATPETVEQLKTAFGYDRVVVAPALEASAPDLSPDRSKEILVRVDDVLAARAYSMETHDNYRLHLLRFFKRLGKDPATETQADVRKYLLEMLRELALSGLGALYVLMGSLEGRWRQPSTSQWAVYLYFVLQVLLANAVIRLGREQPLVALILMPFMLNPRINPAITDPAVLTLGLSLQGNFGLLFPVAVTLGAHFRVISALQ